jgi:magnesium-transporting ATPase (P-type)
MVQDAKEDEEKSPLAQKLDEFGNYLTYIIGIICVVVWVINFRNFYDEIHGGFFNGMIYYFKISVALAVAAIPEGLPAVITTCFALGSRRMSANNAIVRKLDAIETLGCTSVVCSDKTGTLTTNNMSVVKFMTFNESLKGDVNEVSGTSFKPEGEVINYTSVKYENEKNTQNMVKCATMCNLSQIKLEKGEKEVYSIGGSPTEGAIRVFAEKMGQYNNNFDKNQTKSNPMAYINFLNKYYKVMHILEFDRNRKAMSVIAIEVETKKPILFTKGASENNKAV